MGVAQQRGCWMGDAGCGVLGAKRASLSRAVPPGDLPWCGQGAGRANTPHHVLQIHWLSHGAAGEHWEHPPIRLTRRKRGRGGWGGKTPGGWGSELVRLPFCCSKLVKVCPLTIPFASFKQ